MLVWFASLFVLRIIPRHHWDPILHITKSALKRKSALTFDTKAGLSSLKAPERRALRTAVVDRLPPASLAPSGAVDGHGRRPRTRAGGRSRRTDGADEEIGRLGDTEGARLVRLLRGAGRAGGIAIDERGELDGDISLYLFSDQPVAVRLRKMRQLLTAGADASELRVLEGLRDDLVKISPEAWAVRGAGAGRRRARGNGKGRGQDGKGRGSDGKRGGGRRREARAEQA